MIEIRKIITTRETVFSELGLTVSRPGTGSSNPSPSTGEFSCKPIS